jgi:Tol biopolymer transport system component
MTRTLVIATALLALSACLSQATDLPREQKYHQAVDLLESKGDVKGAIKLFEDAAKSPDRNLAARSLLYLGSCYEKLGQDGAQKAYERLVREFADQLDVTAKARGRLAAMATKQPETGITVHQVGKIGDRQFGHTVSKDGRYGVFTLPTGVYLYDLSAGAARPVLERKSPEEHFSGAIISPDGRRVAYGFYVSGAPASPDEIRVVDIDGSHNRTLVAGNFGPPKAWSPDGKQLLVARSTASVGQPDRVLVSTEDGHTTVIGKGRFGEASFSPDGRQIAGTSFSPNRNDIFVQPVSGGPDVLVVQNAGIDPTWTPDGRRILFVSDRSGTSDLWSVPIVDGKAARGPEFVKERVDYLVGVSGNGDCYYTTSNMARDLYLASVDPETGRLISQPKQLTTRDVAYGAAWSPDGENLAYYSVRGMGTSHGSFSIVIHPMKTGSERDLSPKRPLDLFSYVPQWFSDGRSLFLYSRAGKLGQLDIGTGEYQPFLDSVKLPLYSNAANPVYNTFVVRSPDEHAIYHLVRDEAEHVNRVMRLEVQTNQDKELCHTADEAIQSLALSPDGRRLAFITARRETGSDGTTLPVGRLMTVAANGGEPKELYGGSVTKPGPWRSAVWSKDGRRVFFVTGMPTPDIWSIPADGGRPEPLSIKLHDLYFLNLHPDGNQIVFADEQWNKHLWVLKNLFSEAKTSR